MGAFAMMLSGCGGSGSDGPPEPTPPPPNRAPAVTVSSTATVTENDAGAVITSVGTSDADGDNVTLSVDDDRFEVSDGNLKLKDGEFLDYEEASSVEVVITASDRDDSTTATVTITVTDVAVGVEFADATDESGIMFARGYQGDGDTGDSSPYGQDADAREFAGGVAAGDYDNDGDVNLFVVRGDIGPNLLYRNLGDATFEEMAEQAGVAYTRSATENYRHSGPGFADLDGDGHIDLYIGGIIGDPAKLYRNNGDGTFSDVTAGSGLDSMNARYTLSPAFGAFDLDGDLDLYHTNGWVHVDDFAAYHFDTDTSRLFLSDGEGKFEEMSREAGIVDIERGHGIVCGDLDNDGDVDVFQMHRNENNAGTLWRKDTNQNNYLRVKLNGRAPNTAAAGARITVTVNGADQLREIIIGSNFTSQNPLVQVFGLGKSAQADVQVEWPDGTTTPSRTYSADQLVTIDHPDR